MTCKVCGRFDCRRHQNGTPEIVVDIACEDCGAGLGVYRVAFDATLCARCRSTRRGAVAAETS